MHSKQCYFKQLYLLSRLNAIAELGQCYIRLESNLDVPDLSQPKLKCTKPLKCDPAANSLFNFILFTKRLVITFLHCFFFPCAPLEFKMRQKLPN